MIDRCIENCFEFLSGDNTVTATVSDKKFLNKIKKLNSLYPNDVVITAVNNDGSIVAHIPLDLLYIRYPKRVSK